MSQAFMKEGDDMSLGDISPTLNALIVFLTRDNNGVRVYETGRTEATGRTVHKMSNGLSYAKGNSGKWEVIETL